MKLKESYFRFLARLHYQYLKINSYDKGDIIFHKIDYREMDDIKYIRLLQKNFILNIITFPSKYI